VFDADGGRDNFAPLASVDWQLHVYGDAPAGVRTVCASRGLPLHVFRWSRAAANSGLERNALYLVRPDGYVGLATARPEAVAEYLDVRHLHAL